MIDHWLQYFHLATDPPGQYFIRGEPARGCAQRVKTAIMAAAWPLSSETLSMARRILNRKELRADFDAAERRKDEVDRDEDEELEEEEEEEEEEESEEEEEEGEAEEDLEEDEEEAPKKRKAKAAKPAKVAKPKARSRAAKVTRMRVVWGVFNNSNQCVATYEYPRRQEAINHANRLTADKRSTHFIQPVKEPMEEKKEDKKEK
jgi:cobalamin biosynthesis protein CobT